MLEVLRARLQGGLDALNGELAPEVDPFRRANFLQADQPSLA